MSPPKFNHPALQNRIRIRAYLSG